MKRSKFSEEQVAYALPPSRAVPDICRLCLPFIRLIGSRRAPQVLMMKSTNARDAYHSALARPLHSPRLG